MVRSASLASDGSDRRAPRVIKSFRSQTLLATAALAGAVMAWAPPAAAQTVKTPSCAAMNELARKLDPKDIWQLSPTNRMALPVLFQGPELEAVWGKPAMDWGPEDFKIANTALRACNAENAKAKRTEEYKLVGQLYNSLVGTLAGVRNALINSDRNIQADMKILLAQQPSRELLVCFGALRKIKGAGKDVQNVVYNNPDMRYVRAPFGQSARNISIAVRDGRPESIDPYHETIVKKFEELRAPVVEQLNGEVAAFPESPEGLRQLGIFVKNTQTQLGATLPEEDMAAINKAANGRQIAIEEAMLAQASAAIDGLPVSVQGINGLVNISRNPAVTVLTGQRAVMVKDKLLSRRDAIVNGIVDQEIAKLADLKGFDGLKQIQGVQSQAQINLQQVASADSMTRFNNAVNDRATQLGKDSFNDFRKQVTAIPENEKGAAELDMMMNQIRAPLARFDDDTRKRYNDAAERKKKDIVEAVAAEEKRAERRPLAGATYAIQGGGFVLEFRDRKRVYVTNPGGMVEGTYEVDGERVIVRIPNSNFVLKREGSWLRGGAGMMAMDFRRQPDK